MKCCFASPKHEITAAKQGIFLGNWLPVLVGCCSFVWLCPQGRRQLESLRTHWKFDARREQKECFRTENWLEKCAWKLLAWKLLAIADLDPVYRNRTFDTCKWKE